jgi:hypothetical protein
VPEPASGPSSTKEAVSGHLFLLTETKSAVNVSKIMGVRGENSAGEISCNAGKFITFRQRRRSPSFDPKKLDLTSRTGIHYALVKITKKSQ